MIRTIVAFERAESREKITEMLEKAGISVRFGCKSGAEVIRAVKLMGSGVIICGHKLADMSADRLAHELHRQARFLVLAKPAQLAMCEDPTLFKLPVPLSPGELRGSVNILLQMDELAAREAVPHRSPEDSELIAKAKEFLMERYGFTEEQAHRHLQRMSMRSSTKMAETARQVLSSETKP